MAVDPSVKIDIAAEFTGRKAFNKADTATQKLTKNVKSLAKGFLGVFAAQKLLSYSKASVKAFAADDAAAKSLGITLKNLSLAYGSNEGTVSAFINNLERQTGVLDDELRPAMDRLLRATGDVAKSQELLNLALNIAAGTGKTVTQVSQSLQKAYLGQTAAIGRLGVGLSKAELASSSFEDIQKKLNTLFAGQSTAAAETYLGSLNRLTIASNNAKEIIGKSLVGALQSLGKDDSIATLASNIEGAATSLANFTDSLVYLKEQVKSIPGAGIFGYLFSGVTDLLGRFSPQRLAELIKGIKGFQGMGNVAMTGGSNVDTQKFELKQKKLAEAKIKADKLAAANKLKLEKAAAVFDIQRIQIAAALKGKITDEEKTRLLLMQAIEEGNADKAEALSKKLEEIQKKNEAIAKSLTEISAATNPFEAWVDSLGAAVALLAGLGSQSTGTGMPALVNPDGTLTPRGKKNIPTGGDSPSAAEVATPAAIIETVVNTAEEIAKAADAVVKAAEVITGDAARSSDANKPNFGIGGQPLYDQNGMYDYSDYLATSSGSSGTTSVDNSVTINVEGSVLNGDDFNEIMNRAMLDNIRKGLSQVPAGTLP